MTLLMEASEGGDGAGRGAIDDAAGKLGQALAELVKGIYGTAAQASCL